METSVVGGFVVAAFLVSVVPGPDLLFVVANAAVGVAEPEWSRRRACRPDSRCTPWQRGGLPSKFLHAGSTVRRRLERVGAGIFAALAARLATDIH